MTWYGKDGAPCGRVTYLEQREEKKVQLHQLWNDSPWEFDACLLFMNELERVEKGEPLGPLLRELRSVHPVPSAITTNSVCAHAYRMCALTFMRSLV